MTTKSDFPRVTSGEIEAQLAAFNLAHEAIKQAGEFTHDELGIVKRTGELFAAIADYANEGAKGITRLEVMGLLSFAQTVGMVMIGALHEGAGKDSDLRNFYRRQIGPLIRAVEQHAKDFKAANDDNGSQPAHDCPECQKATGTLQ